MDARKPTPLRVTVEAGEHGERVLDRTVMGQVDAVLESLNGSVFDQYVCPRDRDANPGT